MARRIVIIGGGFAGIKCAEVLKKQLLSTDEVILFNKENHMVFHPLLAEVVGASLSPEDVAAPLRQLLPGVQCRTEEVQNIDLKMSRLEYQSYDGHSRWMDYDHIVIASGGVVNLGLMPGMADHAFPMKTVGDALALRNHVMQQLEQAEVCDDPIKKCQYLSFIVVGGGYSGVEVAGEIQDLAQSSCRFFHNIKAKDISVTLIHSQDQVLPEISPKLRAFAQQKMQKAGINLLLNQRVSVATAEGVGLKDGRFIAGATIVCTIGTATAPLIERLSAIKERGRLVTEADMRLQGYKNAWSVGDCAQIINSYDGKVSPPTGQFAERQGRQTANNIVRALAKQSTKPFYFKPLGQLCSIGGHNAVAEMMGLQLSGVLAWFIWRGVYLFKLPSWSRRIKVGFDWAWELVFSRDLTHLKADQTSRVSHAYYQKGDYVFEQGDHATNFYIIEHGEVEIIQKAPCGREDVVATLGEGAFFGEMALLNNDLRNASVRAKTTVEVIVMGRNVFTQVSKSLAPLHVLLTQAVQQRANAHHQNAETICSDMASNKPALEMHMVAK